jgi:hypothetical protein
MDEPDSFGRATNVDQRAPFQSRRMVRFQFRFVRLSVGTQGKADLGGGVELERKSVSLPDGVARDWNDTQSRGYFEGQTAGLTAVSVATTRRTVEAGIQVHALAAHMPGGRFRLGGSVVISSFTDDRSDPLGTAQQSLPVDWDGECGQWYRVYVSEGLNAKALLAFSRWKVNLSASASAVGLEIRVD